MRVVLLIVGIFLLIKGRVKITENTELPAKKARILGLVAFIPSIVAIIITALNLTVLKSLVADFSVLDLAVFVILFGGVYYLKKPIQNS